VTLPTIAANETWEETVITIPAGKTSFQVGITWNNSVATDKFYLNDFEIVKLGTNATEYQYNMKDHLGNTRLTFTTKRDQVIYTATLEDNSQTTEQAAFRNYSRTDFDLFDHTDAGTTYHYAQMLNGSASHQVGLAKSISVMPGDTIRAEVYAKYWNQTSTASNLTGFAAALTGAFGLSAGAIGEGGLAYSALSAQGGTIGTGGGHSNPTSGPKAFITMLVFDKNYNFVNAAWDPIDVAATQVGAVTKYPHDLLSTGDVVVQQAGYVYIYISNESATLVDVYFDDVKITHTKSPVIQQDDYYPFGLVFSEYKKENSLGNKYKFQRQEHIEDLDLNWDSFKWRNAQPDIGRFFGIDPLADSYVYNSPYAFAENKLGLGIELEGLELLPLSATYILEASPAMTRPTIMLENPIKTAADVTSKTTETAGKSSTAENFARGNKVEGEQLAKNGLEKNTTPYKAIDPKTGQTGKTVPDAVKGGKTTEIKSTKSQSFTRQLRLQRELSKSNGEKPELIINKDAKLSEPLKKAGFDIKLYQSMPADATKVAPSPKSQITKTN
jgi:Restriction endonuclease fold toxin 7